MPVVSCYRARHAVLEAAVAQKLRFKADRLNIFFDRLDRDHDGKVMLADLEREMKQQSSDLEEMLIEEGCIGGITRDKFFELFLGKDFMDRKYQAETFARTNRPTSPRQRRKSLTVVPMVEVPTVEVPTAEVPTVAVPSGPIRLV